LASVKPRLALRGLQRGWRIGAALLGGLALTSCTPGLDWREFRPEGASALQLLYPCKPDGHARQLNLAGQPVRLTLHACRADGATWGLAWADVGDPARVAPALQALRQAFEANVAASASVPSAGWRVPGATPQPASGHWTLQGRLPEGGVIHGEVAVFAHGTRVFQATVLSERARAEDAATFMGSLRVGG
jgi:hypothetical protein